jgi:cell division protein FtsQ
MKLRSAKGAGLGAAALGVAAALFAALLLVAALATGGRGARMLEGGRRLIAAGDGVVRYGQGLVDSHFADLGFRVGSVQLQGASQASRAEILAAAAIPNGVPIFGLDLDAIRARVERVGWVDRAKVLRLLPDTLVITVAERPLMAVWQHQGRRDVVATNGQVMGSVDPNAFRELPLIVGDGANSAVSALLPEIMRRPRLAARLSAFRRVDDRRWDVILKDGAVILLPASDEAAALQRLDRLDRDGRALDLGLARIDLRDPEFTVIRPRSAAPATTTHGV